MLMGHDSCSEASPQSAQSALKSVSPVKKKVVSDRLNKKLAV